MTDFSKKTGDLGHVIGWPARSDEPHSIAVQAFVEYWMSMRRDGDVPLRSEIDPRGIEELLPNAFVIEKIAPGLARLRIAGTHLSELMGMDVRGMPLSALIAPHSRTELGDALVDVFDRPAMAQLRMAAPSGFGRQALTGTLVLLPLRSDLGDISRALGCLVTTGKTGRAPRRFSLSDTRITPLDVSVKVQVTPARAAPAPQFAEAPATFQHAAEADAANPSERSYLRLVRND